MPDLPVRIEMGQKEMEVVLTVTIRLSALNIAIPTSLLPNSCKKESVFSDASIPTWNI